MSTSSTAPALIDATVTLMAAEMTELLLTDVKTSQVWPGPDAQRRMFFLGETTWANYEIASIKAGRKQRDEAYEVEFEIWVLGDEGTTPSNPTATRTEAYAMLTGLENVGADDPNFGLALGQIQWAQVRPKKAGPRQFSKGWAYIITGAIVAHARLY